MSIERVKEYLRQYNKEDAVMEFSTSSATVELAAETLGVIPARIAKSLAFKAETACILIITAGDTKIDNKKFKDEFSIKAKMLTADEVKDITGHEVGGVCPFGLKNPDIRVYCDESMKRFSTVFPACGSSNSAIELTCDELYSLSKSLKWVDVCKIK